MPRRRPACGAFEVSLSIEPPSGSIKAFAVRVADVCRVSDGLQFQNRIPGVLKIDRRKALIFFPRTLEPDVVRRLNRLVGERRVATARDGRMLEGGGCEGKAHTRCQNQ